MEVVTSTFYRQASAVTVPETHIQSLGQSFSTNSLRLDSVPYLLSLRIFILPFTMILLPQKKIPSVVDLHLTPLRAGHHSSIKLLAQVHSDSISVLLMQLCDQTFSRSSISLLLLFKHFAWIAGFCFLIEFIGVTVYTIMYVSGVQYIICKLYCVFTTPGPVSFHYHLSPL